MQLSTRLGWGLLLGLLSGCRSEQAAFSFQPAATIAVASTPPVAAPVAPSAALPLSPERPRPFRPQPPSRHHSPATAPKPVVQGSSRTIQPLRRLAQLRRQPEATTARPQRPARHDTLHIILGTLLIVGGIIGGIALGGWLGLGVGAIVVLLGYYFLVLGIGGEHAWLEIFQEFFNM